MTKEQKQALQPVLEALKKSFASAQKRLTSPGHGRDWFVPYLCEVLRSYHELRKIRVGSVKLIRALGSTRRKRLSRLIKRTSNRDPKMRSRWATALTNALEDKVKAQDLEDWLKAGGGISGRANRRRPDEPAETEQG